MEKSIIFLLATLYLIVLVPISQAEIEFKAVLIPDTKIKELKQKIEAKQQPTYSAYIEMKKIADQEIDRTASVPEHWYIPGYYRDAEGHTQSKAVLQNDANIAYQLALAYCITENEVYSQTAARLAYDWATGIKSMSKKDDSTLSFSYHFPAMIFAADLIRGSEHWTKNHEQAFNTFLREKALPMNTMNRDNNWGNWGLVLVMSCAAYLEDQDLMEKGIDRWKTFIETQIAEDGHMPHEVHRSEGMRGIWYTHFALFPQTIAAEIARVNGVDLFNYQSPNDCTLKMAYELASEWANKPDTFPYLEDPNKELRGTDYVSYFEILYPRWPNSDAREILERLRPMSARHSAPVLTLTHGVKFNSLYEE